MSAPSVLHARPSVHPQPDPLLRRIVGPADLTALQPSQLPGLAAEIRELLVASTATSGGHLGSNLGVVELSIALHRVFRSPYDRILFDTGHQAYVHKMLTGRAAEFVGLRRRGGLSGYPSRVESAHDLTENSHASGSVSFADGLARGFRLSGQGGRRVVTVIGDGAMTGGVAWEALNNLGAQPDARVVVVLNDNGRSYAPTVGGLPRHLSDLARRGGHRSVFSELGLHYLGPVDGHDLDELHEVLAEAGECSGPVVVHCRTTKGKGYLPAEQNEVDRHHAVPAQRVGPLQPPSRPSWTSVFGAELLEVAEAQPEVVALTAAMLGPTGLQPLADRFPDRVIDVGIAEQHAVAAAAGLAASGCRPVVALYATFLNRAFDQVLMDVALHRAPVVFVLDRAGVTGEDGPSHHGVWDLSILRAVPGLRVAAPRDATTLRLALREAVRADEPCVLRFPKGPVNADLPAVEVREGLDLLRRTAGAEVLVVAVGGFAALATEAADLLTGDGLAADVVDPRWVQPVDPALVRLGRHYRLVVVVEDGLASSGVGAALAQLLADGTSPTPVLCLGLPTRFIEHGSRDQLLEDAGLTPDQVAGVVGRRLRRARQQPPSTSGSCPQASRPTGSTVSS